MFGVTETHRFTDSSEWLRFFKGPEEQTWNIKHKELSRREM